jgi:hypothetical protein
MHELGVILPASSLWQNAQVCKPVVVPPLCGYPSSNAHSLSVAPGLPNQPSQERERKLEEGASEQDPLHLPRFPPISTRPFPRTTSLPTDRPTLLILPGGPQPYPSTRRHADALLQRPSPLSLARPLSPLKLTDRLRRRPSPASPSCSSSRSSL